jgi:hypothetical protein
MMRTLRSLRRPKCCIILAALVFVGMGTFYWSLWEIPWLPSSAAVPSDDPWSLNATDLEHDSDAPLRPDIPECINDFARIRPRNRYCVWNTTLRSCHEILMPALHNQPSWVFLGDSGMANLPYYISLKWPFGALNITTRRHPCQNLAYYRLPPPNHEWIPPDPSKGEGPMGHALENPYCMNCKKCWNLLMENPVFPERYVEYLVVEYARDVSIPTLVTNTTQETAIYYLRQRHRAPPTVCVASAGLHDAAIDPPISLDMYLTNVDKYLALLQRTCQHVVWMGMHAVVEGPDIQQSNCKLKQWNNAVMGLLEMKNYDNVYVIDVWEKSFQTDYVDPTTVGKKFYASLSRLFVALMAGPDME